MSKYYVLYYQDEQEKLFSWWSSLNRDRGMRAELRRTESPSDVLLTQGFRRLCVEVAGRLTQERYLLPLAAAAGIVAHVNVHAESCSFAAQLSLPAEHTPKKPRMSELRFAQLQKSRSLDELFIRMVRAVNLIRGTANVLSIVDSILHWAKEMVDGDIDNDPRNRIQVRWGMEYFENLFEKSTTR